MMRIQKHRSLAYPRFGYSGPLRSQPERSKGPLRPARAEPSAGAGHPSCVPAMSRGCLHKLGVLFPGVLKMRAYHSGSVLEPLIVGNSQVHPWGILVPEIAPQRIWVPTAWGEYTDSTSLKLTVLTQRGKSHIGHESLRKGSQGSPIRPIGDYRSYWGLFGLIWKAGSACLGSDGLSERDQDFSILRLRNSSCQRVRLNKMQHSQRVHVCVLHGM